MNQKVDIISSEDIIKLVDTFYEKVRVNEHLGSIFNNAIEDNWPKHLQKMYSFWETVLLDNHTYSGTPFKPHMKLPIDSRHFDHWLKLFNETVDSLFAGNKADEAKWRAAKMAELFKIKLDYYKNHLNQTPIQ